MERITGPYKGFFIAAYTVVNDCGHVGYAKVCVVEPENVWNSDPVEKLTSATGLHTELEAIVAAESKARKYIACTVDSWGSAPQPLRFTSSQHPASTVPLK